MNVFAGSRPPWFPLPPTWRAHAIDTPGYILLETAGGLGNDHVSYLFVSAEKVLRATSASELSALWNNLEAAVHAGFYVAGRMDYEAGYALHNIPCNSPPVAIFGLYRQVLRFDHHTGTTIGPALTFDDSLLQVSAKPLLSPPHLRIDPATYAEKFAAVQRLLADGDTYQVNLTTRVDASLLGSPLGLYEALLEAQPVDYAAVFNLDDNLTLSFSPELFFRTERSAETTRISTRPMKGTAPRGRTPEEDTAQRNWLARDEKNRAEHVMIVDLLRNDLGRICEPGTVRTDDLFLVEPYPTLFQMTSTVSGELRPDTRLSDIIRALFPSGSITGAPKRRTMEIIRDLEDSPRGVYTGAIGFLSPSGDACFSVPIRTMDLRSGEVSMGVGGGVVADSTATAEYEECLLKASFLSHATAAPLLIETLLWNRNYPLIDLHISRLSRSAVQLGFRCNPIEIRSALSAAASKFTGETRVRLLLSSDGTATIESAALVGPKSDLRVRIAARRILSHNPWRQHKTTRRALYEREFTRARMDGFDEILFLNEHDELAEGSISNVFVEIDGTLYTPPLTSGALPGVLRQHLLNTQQATEKILKLEELTSTVYLGNALRGLRSVASFHRE